MFIPTKIAWLQHKITSLSKLIVGFIAQKKSHGNLSYYDPFYYIFYFVI